MDNWKTIVLLFAGGQGLLLSMALISKFRKSNKSSFFLGLIVFVFSIEILLDFSFETTYHSNPNRFPFWLFESYLILPPAVYFFVLSNTERNFQFRKVHFLLFIPALIEIVIELIDYAFQLNGKGLNLIEYKAFFIYSEIIPVLWMILVLALSWKKINTISKPLKPTFHLKKLYAFLFYFVLFTVFWLLIVFMDIQIFNYIEILLVAFLFLLGYIGYFAPSFFEVPNMLSVKSVFSNYNDEPELARLESAMEEEELFIQSKLSLKTLAKELKLPAKYVSYLINTYHNTNFHDYINTYRVKEVIRNIEDSSQKNKTILALALESGFNSKSSFNQVFKNHTGKSPSEFYTKK